MKSSFRMPGLVLTGVLLAAFFVLNACAPKAVPLGATLDSPEHHILSGLKLLKLGRYDDALREFDLTKQSDPTFSKAYVGCGLVFAHLEKWERAFQELEKGEKLARTDEEKVFASVGAIRLFVIGQESASPRWLDAAESAYYDAVRLMPDSSEAHFYMAKAYEEAGDLGKACVLYEKVLKIDKTHVEEAKAVLDIMKRSERNQI